MACLRLPLMYGRDFVERDHDCTVLMQNKKHIWLELTPPELENLLGDCRYYADPLGFDPELMPLIRSAQRALPTIEHQHKLRNPGTA